MTEGPAPSPQTWPKASPQERQTPIDKPGRSAARYLWQDAAKGIGIFLVVLGHMERGLVSAGTLQDARWQLFDFALYTFHMPLFMFLAGLNVPNSLAKGTTYFRRSKIVSVLYPYVFWSLLSGMVMAALSHVTNNAFDPRQMLYIAWAPISPFWFLYAIFLFMMLASVLPLRLFLVLASVAFLAGEWLPRDNFGHQLLHFPLFFVAGMALGRPDLRDRMRIGGGVAAGLTLLAAATIAVGHHHGFGNYNSVLMLPAALGGIAAVLWISQRLEGVAALVATGTMSMAIYVMHILAGAGAQIVLMKILHVPPIGWLYLVLCTAIGMGAPVVAYLVMKRLGLLPVFGLALGRGGRRWVMAQPTLPDRQDTPRRL